MGTKVTPGEYARELEAYLCRKNDGHLVRIAGPAFEQVCGWAAHGVPLKVAFEGIDRYFERYYRKGPRRRPVRIEFCEPDILDVFDEWRRAVGIGAVAAPYGPPDDAEEGGARRRGGLKTHIERVLARLVTLRVDGNMASGFNAALADAIARLEAVRSTAHRARGAERERIRSVLDAVDRDLVHAARIATSAEQHAVLMREARHELAPFTARMTPEAYEQAQEACVVRLLRERLRLPEIRFA